MCFLCVPTEGQSPPRLLQTRLEISRRFARGCSSGQFYSLQTEPGDCSDQSLHEAIQNFIGTGAWSPILEPLMITMHVADDVVHCYLEGFERKAFLEWYILLLQPVSSRYRNRIEANFR